MNAGRPRVSVVVLSWNGASLLPSCLDALAAQQPPPAIWLVDNGSSDGTVALVRAKYPLVHVVETGVNLGFAGGNNVALRQVDTEYVALVNNDAVTDPGWLSALVSVLDADPGVAAVTGKILLSSTTGDRSVINSAGGWMDADGHGRDIAFGEPDTGQRDQGREVFYAPATACLYRTSALREVGFLDPSYFLYYEDVDLCWRLRAAGWSVRYEPSATARHAHSASAVSGSPTHLFFDARNRLLMLAKLGPASVAVRAAARLPVTALGAVVRGDRARAAVLIRAWLSYWRLLPGAIRARRRHAATGGPKAAELWATRERLRP